MRDEELRARLRDLHDAAASAVAPPGVHHARRALRRRRLVRTTLASTALAVLCALAIVLPNTAFRPPKPSTSTSPSASPPPPSATPDAQPSTPDPPPPPSGGTPSPSGGRRASNVGLAPYFVEYGDSLSTSVGKDGSTDIPIGVVTWGSGTATSVKMTIDLSQIASKVDIVAVGAPCSRSGSTVVCDYGTLAIKGQKRIGTTLSLRAKPDATLGKAGTVHLSLTADSMPASSASVTVNVESSVADLVITSAVPSAHVGQTVTVTYTVKNQGPSPEPYVALIGGEVQTGTQYVGGNGCTFTATTFECRIDNLAVGQTRVLSVAVRVNGCVPRGDTTNAAPTTTFALADPNYWNNDAQLSIRVQGC